MSDPLSKVLEATRRVSAARTQGVALPTPPGWQRDGRLVTRIVARHGSALRLVLVEMPVTGRVLALSGPASATASELAEWPESGPGTLLGTYDNVMQAGRAVMSWAEGW